MLDQSPSGGLHQSFDGPPTIESFGSGISWSAIVGGAFASTSIALLFLILGTGFGLASASPLANTGTSTATVTVVTGIWLIVLHWSTSGLGGYLTGRLRIKWTGLHTHEVFFRDTANGFLSWAVACVFGAILVASTAAFTVGGAATIATGATTLEPSPYLLDRLFRTEHLTAPETIAYDKAQTVRIIANGFMVGAIPAPDMAYLSQIVSAQTGVSSGDAGQRIDQMIADEKGLKRNAQQAADAARKASTTLTIFTGLAMLIGAFIACVAAALGGQRRDIH